MSNLTVRHMPSSSGLATLWSMGVIVLVTLPLILPPYYVGLVVKMMVFALFAMSLDLLLGYAGMPSLGHAAYFGMAAYTTGLLALKAGWTVWLALPAGIAMAALTSVVFGLLALRTRGSYFLMITLALSQVLWGIAFGWRSLTGGDDGLPEVPRPDLSLPWSMSDNTPFYYFVLLFFVVGTLVLVRVVASPFGYVLRGIRESETRMLVLGYNVWRYKLVAFVVAAAFAGLAGCLYVYFNRFVSPDYVHVVRSAEVLLMVILGGAGTLIGPAVGATLIVLLENLISTYTERWVTVLGVIYVLVALLAPNGIAGLIASLRRQRGGP
jgi:branched-chain amino acid transport system permease protein